MLGIELQFLSPSVEMKNFHQDLTGEWDFPYADHSRLIPAEGQTINPAKVHVVDFVILNRSERNASDGFKVPWIQNLELFADVVFGHEYIHWITPLRDGIISISRSPDQVPIIFRDETFSVQTEADTGHQ